jgi:integrase
MIQPDLHDGTRLSGSRPLTTDEERVFLRRVRRLSPRNRALITALMFLGFRISEVLALTIGHVMHRGLIRSHVALPPSFLKGKRGNTRSVPIGPELHRALERYLVQRKHSLWPTEPLFLSRFHRFTCRPHVPASSRSSSKPIGRDATRAPPQQPRERS